MIPWPLWQQRRIAELQAEGMGSEIAQQVGKVETATRQRISRCIGWRAARAAKLNILVDGNNVRFALTGGLAGLTALQRQRLLELPNLSPVITPAA
ncbi:hypothetical protein [Sphingomonas aerolata]|uniref:hypothetical protein n=1 Tax=Sphingomonas aerolata TaxID=185951 RepID=UPI000D3706C1|nr:hypothetical protein [Sphingomonas aerolata]